MNKKEKEQLLKIINSSPLENAITLHNDEFMKLTSILSTNINYENHKFILNSIFHLSELFYMESLMLYSAESL